MGEAPGFGPSGALSTPQVPLDPAFRFAVGPRDGSARLGLLETPHGAVRTPAFMPVGTQGTVKGLLPEEVAASGAEMILANTYHLWLRPGPDLVAAHGGLHGFTGWRGPMLTDSGGFQVFSLRDLRQIGEGGVDFRDHLDGSRRHLGPEEAMDIQEALGADIAMALDECSPYPCAPEELRRATARTTRWAERAVARHSRRDQALFGIVQGGTDPALRRQSAREIVQLGFSGYAVGSLSVGEPLEIMRRVLEETVPLLPEDRPRYLMGVGSPDYLLEAVWAGIDLFDCVLPTRIARNGTALVLPRDLCGPERGSPLAAGRIGDDGLPEGRTGRLVVRNARYARDLAPLDAGCACPACGMASRAYLRHLFSASEMLGPRLLSLHNLHTLGRFVQILRGHVASGTLGAFRQAFWESSVPWSALNRGATTA